MRRNKYKIIKKSATNLSEKLFNEFFSWLQCLLSLIPGQIGFMVRGYILRLFFKRAGRSIIIGQNVYISSPQNLEVGNDTGFSCGCFLDATGHLKIGSNVLVGPYVTMVTSIHVYSNKDIPIKDQGWTLKEIIIEDDVWISSGVIINGGVRIGKSSIIAASSVVTKDVPPFSIITGIPGKIKRKR